MENFDYLFSYWLQIVLRITEGNAFEKAKYFRSKIVGILRFFRKKKCEFLSKKYNNKAIYKQTKNLGVLVNIYSRLFNLKSGMFENMYFRVFQEKIMHYLRIYFTRSFRTKVGGF